MLIEGVPVLGKGFSSIVAAVVDLNGRIMALKIRRLDSRRDSLDKEAHILVKASKHRLAPHVYWWNSDFIAMEYIQGPLLESAPSLGLIDREVSVILSRILGKAYVLDAIGIDHGELSRPHRHVILAGLEPFFLDFESASETRRPHNLSSIVSALLLSNTRISAFFKRFLRPVSREAIIEALREYKVHRVKGYRLLLERLGLLSL